MSGTSMSNPTTNELWDKFCQLRRQSRAYRAVDDPVVRRAHEDWRRADEQDSTNSRGNIIAFPIWRVARGG